MQTVNQPYVKQYDDDGNLLNPIGPEGYLHTQPSTRRIKQMLKKKSLNCRKDRNFIQQVYFFKDSEGKIVKDVPQLELIDGVMSGKYTGHKRTIEHKLDYLKNHSTGPKDYTIYEVVINKSEEE